MKRTLRNVLIIFTLLTGRQAVAHSWLAGADITYRQLSATRYELRLELFRNCNHDGLSATLPDASSEVFVYGGGLKYNLNFNRVSIEDVSLFCKKDSTPPCQNVNASNSNGLGAEKHVYLDTIDFAYAPYNQFMINHVCQVYFTVQHRWRPSALIFGANDKMVVRSMLNLCISGGNNSVTFANPVFYSLPLNNSIQYSPAAYDMADNDSLSFHLVPMEKDTGVNVVYADTNFNPERPFTAYYPTGWGNRNNSNPNVKPAIGTSYSPGTGHLVLNPMASGEWSGFVFEIREWRKINGQPQMVGFVRRENLARVMPMPGNLPPELPGPYAFQTRPDSQFCIVIEGKDPLYVPPSPQTQPPPDSVDLSWSNNIQGATFTVDSFTTFSGSWSTRRGTFCWTPGQSNVRSTPYLFTVKAKDNNCSYSAESTKEFSIQVLPLSPADYSQEKIRKLACGVIEVSDSTEHMGVPVSHGWTLLDSNRNSIKTVSKAIDTLIIPGKGRFYIRHTMTTPGFWPVSRVSDSLVSKDCFNTTISGSVWHDKDSNCKKSSSEYGLKNQIIEVVRNDGKKFYVNTDENGDYSMAVPLLNTGLKTGKDTFKVNYVPREYWKSTCQDSSFQVVPMPDTVTTLDFGGDYRFKVCDAEVILSSYTGNKIITRGAETQYVITINNLGSKDIPDMRITLQRPEDFTLISSTIAPASTTPTTIVWDLHDLGAGIDSSVSVTFTGRIPVTTPLYTMLDFSATLDPMVTPADINSDNNSDRLRQKVVAAVDPNDKQSTPENYVTSKDKEVNYQIRFQNTGNAYASKVTIVDTIDVSLPITSVHIIAASHKYKFQVKNNVFTWTFDNIHLPDSGTDFVKSQGFVKFKMNLNANMNIGQKIKNKAYIYFDYEPPVRTNEVDITKVNPKLQLLSPTAGMNLIEGSVAEIKWHSEYVNGINISFSSDNMAWSPLAEYFPADSGKYTWLVPSALFQSGTIRIRNSFDTTLEAFASFFIVDSIRPRVIVMSPNGGELIKSGSQHEVKWQSVKTNKLSIYTSTNDGQSWDLALNNVPASAGKIAIAMPDVESGQCRIKLVNEDSISIYDESDANFTLSENVSVTPPDLKSEFMLYPNPASAKLMIENSGTEEMQLEVYNILGEKIISFTLQPYETRMQEVHEWPQGLYMVRVTGGTGTQKVLIRH